MARKRAINYRRSSRWEKPFFVSHDDGKRRIPGFHSNEGDAVRAAVKAMYPGLPAYSSKIVADRWGRMERDGWRIELQHRGAA